MWFLLLAIFVASCQANEKIIGGHVATKSQFPFIVHLDSKESKALCGGSVYNENYVLCAAHCRQLGSTYDYRIVAGDHLLYSPEDTEQKLLVQQFIPHPAYSPNTEENDIMLIYLAGSLDFSSSSVSPIQLPSETPEPETLCTIAGWGTMNANQADYPEILHWIEAPVIASDTCNLPDIYNGQVLNSMICIGYLEGGKDSCQGDSGGPAVLAGTAIQVGIVSWGVGCALPNKPGVYTNVYNYNEWIGEITAD